MSEKDIKQLIIDLIEFTTRECGYPLINGKIFSVNEQLKGRKNDNNLPPDSTAVYSFFYQGQCLKVGQVGTNSNARFKYQHYLPKSNKSTLARSIINDEAMDDSIKNNVGTWLKNNTDRFDVLIKQTKDKHLDKIILNLIEGILQYKFRPRYENKYFAKYR